MRHRLAILVVLLCLTCYGVESSLLPRIMAEIAYEILIYLPMQAFSSLEFVTYGVWLPFMIYWRNSTRDFWRVEPNGSTPDSVLQMRSGIMAIVTGLNVTVSILFNLGILCQRIMILMINGRNYIQAI